MTKRNSEPFASRRKASVEYADAATGTRAAERVESHRSCTSHRCGMGKESPQDNIQDYYLWLVKMNLKIE